MQATSSITCRLFEPSDLRALYAIEEVCFDPPLRFSRALMRSLAYDPNSRTWMAFIDEIRVGFAMVGLRGDENQPQNGTGNSYAAYIWTIEVLPAFRRMGVARALMARVEESALEADCTTIELHVSARNQDALALYEGAAYEHFAIEQEFYGKGIDGFRYRKLLNQPQIDASMRQSGQS